MTRMELSVVSQDYKIYRINKMYRVNPVILSTTTSRSSRDGVNQLLERLEIS